MSDVVTVEIVGNAGLVAIDSPPVNAAGVAVRSGLFDAVTQLEANDAVSVIAIYAKGRTFIAGADIREFGKPPQEPVLVPSVVNSKTARSLLSQFFTARRWAEG